MTPILVCIFSFGSMMILRDPLRHQVIILLTEVSTVATFRLQAASHLQRWFESAALSKVGVLTRMFLQITYPSIAAVDALLCE
jgi:hypothetical protein